MKTPKIQQHQLLLVGLLMILLGAYSFYLGLPIAEYFLYLAGAILITIHFANKHVKWKNKEEVRTNKLKGNSI